MKQLLGRFFTYAVKQKLVSENPIPDIVLCRPSNDDEGEDGSDEGKCKALREEIRSDVLIWAKENPIIYPIIIVFMFAGLRPQELIALEWVNVNLDNCTLSVKKALKSKYKFDDDGNVVEKSAVIGKTKTKKSVRTFEIPVEIVDALVEWQEYCKENNIHSSFVFPETDNNNRRSYYGLCSLLKRFIKRHGLEAERISWYTFRHTYATMMLEEGANPKDVAERMGHTRLSTFLDFYCHVASKKVRKETTETLSGIFTRLMQNKNQQTE